MRFHLLFSVSLCLCGSSTSLQAAARYHEVTYPPSTKAGELQLGVTYTLWLPDGVSKLRGVIVHQHGCGSGACKGGETSAYDLHWQALAKKWDCALFGPSYHQDDKQNCQLWCNPNNGSNQTFLRALSEFAKKSKHPELEQVPWCLWGHSGGGVWATYVQLLHPDRIVAIWCRSGTVYMRLGKDDPSTLKIPDSVYQVPVMCNPGIKEKGDKRFNGAWTGSLEMFKGYRAKGAPIGFAPDPMTGHECGDSRYLAIPFFDACLAMRLPDKDAREQKLKPVDLKLAWYADVNGTKAEPASAYRGKVSEAVWLPNEQVARVWMEYVKDANVSDKTPPPTPFNVQVQSKDGGTELTWDAEADFESGLRGFVILRDGKTIAELPEKPTKAAGRALFQQRSYHDTPVKPLAVMRFVDKDAKPGGKAVYEVLAVNGVGLKSAPAKASTGSARP